MITCFFVVDYYSRYFEVDIIRTANTASIMESLQHMFTTHGLLNSLITDNGPQFISKIFKDYLENNGKSIGYHGRTFCTFRTEQD